MTHYTTHGEDTRIITINATVAFKGLGKGGVFEPSKLLDEAINAAAALPHEYKPCGGFELAAFREDITTSFDGGWFKERAVEAVAVPYARALERTFELEKKDIFFLATYSSEDDVFFSFPVEVGEKIAAFVREKWTEEQKALLRKEAPCLMDAVEGGYLIEEGWGHLFEIAVDIEKVAGGAKARVDEILREEVEIKDGFRAVEYARYFLSERIAAEDYFGVDPVTSTIKTFRMGDLLPKDFRAELDRAGCSCAAAKERAVEYCRKEVARQGLEPFDDCEDAFYWKEWSKA